jgi:aminoglycoside 6'-N-acetyltransferase
VTDGALTFRPMVAEDLPLLHEWLQRPHVRRWYLDHGPYEEVVDRYLPSIEGSDPTDHYIVLLDGRPVGMLQTYVVSDHPEYAEAIGVTDSATAGMDILIGEEELTGRGLGTEVIRSFVEEVVFARSETTACVADPDVGNVASVRAFEKAGFRSVKTFVEDPGDGRLHVLVRRDRQGAQSAPR